MVVFRTLNYYFVEPQGGYLVVVGQAVAQHNVVKHVGSVLVVVAVERRNGGILVRSHAQQPGLGCGAVGLARFRVG